ncbi:AraC family transcriptional regulator [Paenibacillus aceris]|uniref:Iron complex transport system substrate-binding protein n=1 Tax=Paenibacillus aceris TaxID=869555 RepID=A0ABS4IA24_9BACL|nr:AraC family transcriptional regulator [Paenibacillus aceris]MBP1966924.1 iron complex transport system substrate-binding protein [Paenibacillus aceris]NHW38993.1 AraC family transcriptional regulator [Paenibacillus aceris]
MSFQEQILLWNHAALRVLDIRRTIMQPGENVHAYQLPASVFLYVTRGRAQIMLDDIVYTADKCQVCHAGKGTFLDIVNVLETLEYFMVFYKAALALPVRKELLRLQEKSNPFKLQFGLMPQHSISLFLKMEEMHRQWMQTSTLEKFHVKALFHQFVYEMLQQIQDQGSEMIGPEPVGQAIRYMQERYAEQITLQGLAELLDCNARQLQRLFKAKLSMGPMEYLTQVRVRKAKSLLQHTDVPLAEIAEDIGYTDSYYFGRVFKKHVGVSPGRFREQSGQLDFRRQNPWILSQFPIVPIKLQTYSGLSEDEYHYQEMSEGMAMYAYPSPKSSIAVGFMLTFALLLSVCSGPTVASAQVGGSTTHAKALMQTPAVMIEAQESSHKVRTIKHLKGELTLSTTPEKIVVLDTQYIDQLLVLGRQPVGSVIATSDASEFPNYVSDQLGDIKVMGTKEEPDLEAIRRAEPELIVCTEFQAHMYDELVRVAPTLLLDRNADWQKTLQTFGQILGKEQEVPGVMASYQNKIAKLQAELAGRMAGETVALIRPRDNQIRLHTTSHRTADILYSDLGIQAPECAMDTERSSKWISLEALQQVDRLFVLTDDSNKELTGEFQKSELWKGLRAVQANHVYTFNTTMWIGYYGPIAIDLIVDELAESLLPENPLTV